MDTINKNPNAKKWTTELVTTYLNGISGEIERDNVWFLGTALINVGLRKDIWKYWRRTFANDEEIIERMDLIENTIEANLMEAALKNKLSTRMAIWALKSIYKWK